MSAIQQLINASIGKPLGVDEIAWQAQAEYNALIAERREAEEKIHEAITALENSR